MRESKRTTLWGLFGLCFLLPLMMGGCPEFRNDVVSSLETATRNALIAQEDTTIIVETTSESILDAAIGLLFDPFRVDNF